MLKKIRVSNNAMGVKFLKILVNQDSFKTCSLLRFTLIIPIFKILSTHILVQCVSDFQ